MGKLVLNRSGVRQLLRDRDTEAELMRRAEAIARHAGAGFQAESEIGKIRARAAVVTETQEARQAESDHHALLSAMDAGR